MDAFKQAEKKYIQGLRNGKTGKELANLAKQWFLAAPTTDKVIIVWESVDENILSDCNLKWNRIFSRALELAKTIQDCIFCLNQCEDFEKNSKKAVKKMVTLAQNREELTDIMEYFFDYWTATLELEEYFTMIFKRAKELPKTN